jgi:hypothetical protein
MENKLVKFLELAIKIVGVSLFIFIMYWAMTFLYEAAKAIFK